MRISAERQDILKNHISSNPYLPSQSTPKRDKRNQQYLNNGNVHSNKSLIQKVFERRKETNIAIMNKESQKVLDRLVDGKIINGTQSVSSGTP